MSDTLMETVLYVTPSRGLQSRLIDGHFFAKLLSVYNRLTSMTLLFSRNIGGTIQCKISAIRKCSDICSIVTVIASIILLDEKRSCATFASFKYALSHYHSFGNNWYRNLLSSRL